MKIKNIITLTALTALTALSALVLSGCVSNTQPEEKLDENKPGLTEEVGKPNNELDSPYNEIAKYFSEWELPKEGVIPKDNEAYEKWNIDVTAYENGYVFDTKTKQILDRTHSESKADPGQFGGIIMGFISEIADELALLEPIEKLSENDDPHTYTRILNEHSEMIFNRFLEIASYSVDQEDLSKISKEVVGKAEYIEQKTAEGEGEKTLEELSLLKSQYDEMVNRINELNEAVERAIL